MRGAGNKNKSRHRIKIKGRPSRKKDDNGWASLFQLAPTINVTGDVVTTSNGTVVTRMAYENGILQCS